MRLVHRFRLISPALKTKKLDAKESTYTRITLTLKCETQPIAGNKSQSYRVA